MKFLKNSKYKVGVVLLVTVLLVCCMTSCYAEINIGGASQTSEGAADFMKYIISNVLNTAGGVLGTPIATLINVFSLLIFLILYMLFVATGLTGGTGSDMLSFPFPDQVVFNKIPLLDPNFINPDNASVASMSVAGQVIKNLYFSFFVLATTIFTIAALVIGIKLVFSSIAAEKAKYKEALNNWIVGIVLLFLVHYLMAGMFYLNEQIVATVSNDVANKVVIKFDTLEAVPLVGKSLSKLINGVAGFFGATKAVTAVDLHGYGGIVLKFAIQGFIGLDLISSIIFLIIIGQTFGLVITYVKRTFMCIFLGVMAPVVVAVDVIQKALK